MRIAVAVAVFGACAAGLFAPLARDVHACSIVIPTDNLFASWVMRAPVVAIGRWEGADAREIKFVVEQPLKGTKSGDSFRIDNRTTYTAFSCSPYDEPFREGYRFLDGERAVVLLEKQVDGLWQVGYLGLAAFEVPETLDSPMQGVGWFFGDREAGTQTDIKLSTIVAASGHEGAVSLEPAVPPARPGRPAAPAPTSGSVDRSFNAPAPTGDDSWRWPAIAVAFVAACGALGVVARWRLGRRG